MKSYEKMVKKGSLKLRIMGEIMQNSSNENWISTLYQKHEDDMISILKETYELVN